MEWIAEYNGVSYPPSQVYLPQAKRKYQHRKKEFAGWGSVQLIEFLEAIGKDTSNQISRDDVAAIITGYINEHKLTDPGKKKTVHCDERLLSLFGRKKLPKFSRIRICKLLAAHYAENEEASDDGSPGSSDDEGRSAKRVRSVPERKPQKNRVPKTPTSPFAAIIPENLKLVYLKRSIVQDLLKDFDAFEQKVTRSFVRIKSDPNDYLQKNPYQLLQVTGIRKASKGADMSNEVLLQVPVRDIRISMLSDDNFTEEECEELRQKIKDGVYNKLTRVELEEKVRVLHEDITKHWLVREIALLQNLIDRANEKGWRKELAEYLDRKKVLQNPDEQSRMLLEVPRVTPERMEDESAGNEGTPEQVEDDYAEDDFLEDDVHSLGSPESMLGDSPETTKLAASDMLNFSDHKLQRLENHQSNGERHMSMDLNFNGGSETTVPKTEESSRMIDFSFRGPDNSRFISTSNGASLSGLASRLDSSDEFWHVAVIREPQTKQAVENNLNNKWRPESMDLNKGFEEAAVDTSQVIDFNSVAPSMNRFSASSNGGANGLTSVARGANSAQYLHGAFVQDNLQRRQSEQPNSSNGVRPLTLDLNKGVQGAGEKKVEAGAQVIDLSSDDEDHEPIRRPDPPCVETRTAAFNLESMVWYYMDPRGYTQGPFSLEMLKLWSDSSYFSPDFKVWMVGQDPREATLLTDIFRWIFP